MNPEDLLRELVRKWEELQAKIKHLIEVFQKAVSILNALAAAEVEFAVAFWNENVVPKIVELNQLYADNSNAFGAPWSLWSAGEQWRQDVGSPASARAGMAAAGQVTVDDNWTGSAADAYQQRLSQQETAIKNVQSQFADVIAGALNKVAWGIIAWWVATVVAIGILILTFLVAIGETVSILGLPAMPPSVLLGVAGCLGTFVTGIAGLAVLCGNAKSDLDGARSNLAAYPAGSWPAFG